MNERWPKTNVTICNGKNRRQLVKDKLDGHLWLRDELVQIVFIHRSFDKNDSGYNKLGQF